MTFNTADPPVLARESQGAGGVAELPSRGPGPLVDADQARELAQLKALQASQQFSARFLSLADQAPQTLLSLFR